jgi:A/G-specific adenine glycosylase
LNQALMELGARVCTPKAPRCGHCPIARACAAHAAGLTDELPVAKRKKAPTRVQVVAVVALRGSHVAIVRSEGTLFGGLYGPPTIAGRGRERAREALRAASVSARLDAEPHGVIEHVLSHRVLDVEVWRATATRTDGSLVPLDGLARIGTSTLTRRILALVTAKPRAAVRAHRNAGT